MVQGLVNSFGPVVMAAFAAAVKIDSFAYMPVQDFGNAFSTFVGTKLWSRKKREAYSGRNKKISGTCVGILSDHLSSCFCLAKQLLLIFVQPCETEILTVGVRYICR